MTGFDGALFGGMQAVRVPVRIDVEAGELVIRDAAGERRVAVGEVTVDAPVPGVPRLLRLPGGELIETEAQAEVASVWPTRSLVARCALALESRWWAVVASVALVAVSLWLIVAYALPLAAKPVSARISPGVERVLGEQTLATLDRTAFRPSALPEERQAELRQKFGTLTADEPDGAGYQLRFRKAGVPNALALPGQIIVITDEMVDTLANDAEFTAVIAHEMGHVHERHVMRLILQSSGLIVLMTAIAGDAVGMTVLAAALPVAMLQARYSRQFETEADDYAFAVLKRHGQSPQAFADLLRRLQQRQPGAGAGRPLLEYLSSHPATEERIERAEKMR